MRCGEASDLAFRLRENDIKGGLAGLNSGLQKLKRKSCLSCSRVTLDWAHLLARKTSPPINHCHMQRMETMRLRGETWGATKALDAKLMVILEKTRR